MLHCSPFITHLIITQIRRENRHIMAPRYFFLPWNLQGPVEQKKSA